MTTAAEERGGGMKMDGGDMAHEARVMLMLTILVLGFFGLQASGCGYNEIQGLDEETNAAWSEVLNQYQRRADLVPNLVNVVKGYASHERETLEAVTQARAQATSVKVTPDMLKDSEAFKQF